MKNLFKYGTATMFVALIVGVLALGGCNKRPYTRIAMVPLKISFDWSAAGDGAVLPNDVKLYLFREDGSFVKMYNVPKGGEVLGADLFEMGTYKAICVNVNDYVEVRNTGGFGTAELVAKMDAQSAAAASSSVTRVGKADEGGGVVYQPGWIFSSSLSNIKVGYEQTTEDVKNDGTVTEIIFPMQKRVQVVNFKFTVTGLTNEIKNVTGTLDNVASVIDLATGKVKNGFQAASNFELKSSSEGNHLEGTMLIFGNEVDFNQELKNNLKLKFETESGRQIIKEEDITKQMKEGGGGGGHINIDVNADVNVILDAGLVTVVIKWEQGSTEDIDGV